MQHARDTVRALTVHGRRSLPVVHVVQEVNAFLRGWAGYFRFGHLAERLSKIRRYVQTRVAQFISRRHRRSRAFGWRVLRAADPPEFGLISRYGIVVQPRAGKPWRDKPNAGGERCR
jgi:RNA-directed DNA polymerase